MRIDIMTLFPETVGDMMNESILGRAQERGYIRIDAHQIRDFTVNKQKQVDDYPYGGGLAALGGAAVLAAGLAAAGGQAHDHEQSQNSGQELLQFHFDILLKFMVASFEILPSETHCTTKNKFCPLVY